MVPMLVLFYFNSFIPLLGQGLVAGLWILLATGWFHPAGVGLLANRRIVLGT